MRFRGLHLNTQVLYANSFFIREMRLCVFHPVGREQITKARANFCTVNIVIRRAVRSPRRLSGISGSQSVDILVAEKIGEH